ncbi:hypothetical protein CCACVL1_11898 [Corchorus capsularis]|uniref:Uncharacterized protein n=1 Tax=Corchorus capsularis TaxID=210143 RepID=A0A1R3IJ01_COCAP|nr:hypothetical protein CCACVL1_11898 [Corchorus capsularis]
MAIFICIPLKATAVSGDIYDG